MGLGNAEYGVRSAELNDKIMKNENLKRRTKKFALDVIKLVESLPTWFMNLAHYFSVPRIEARSLRTPHSALRTQ